MQITKVTPRGYCLGVVKSIQMAKKAVKDYPDKKIYMIGLIVHNKLVVEDLESLGIIPLDDWKKDRSLLLEQIPADSVVIFSAHGTDEKVIKKAEEKGLIIIDTKCEWVEVTEILIKQKLKEGYHIIFIGKHDHPETIALTAIDESISLVTNLQEVEDLNITNNKIFVTNQTTLSIIDTEVIYKSIKSKYPDSIFKNDICEATLERQKAILELENKNIDLLYVVGDSRSNNTMKLVELGLQINIRTIRINKVDDIKESDLIGINHIAVTAGASTPSIIQNEVIKFLETK